MTGKTISTANNPHLGSSFDDFLVEEGMLQAATATAVKRVIAWQIEQEMKARHLTKTVLEKKVQTSRAAQADQVGAGACVSQRPILK